MVANFFRKTFPQPPGWAFKVFMNLWPPFIGAGIRIRKASRDCRYIKVRLNKSWYNSNYVGTQFGGSIYAMVDPFFMLMLMKNLGKDYIVWDKAAKIDFKKPGKTSLFAEFRIDEKLLSEVKNKTQDGEKYIFDLPIDIKDINGSVVASAIKTLYVRKKQINSLKD